MVVSRSSDVEPTAFNIFWLVPNQAYLVEIEVNGVCVFDELVEALRLDPGSAFPLNDLGSDTVADPIPSSGTCDGM